MPTSASSLTSSLIRRVAGAWALLCVAGSALAAGVTYHVNGATGADDRDGRSPATAFATIQRAGAVAGPGDRIVVAKGVYYGPVEFTAKGAPGRPVVLEAEDRSRNAVIITNAYREMREGRVAWRLEDQALGLYSAPLAEITARVLYSGVDLQPYGSLDQLRGFVVEGGQPGPAHGYFHDTAGGRIYVRLHASGRYGPHEPAKHVISISPRTGNGSAGTGYNGPTFFNLGIMERQSAHVVVDGFTFETPGFSGVHVNGHDVVVRNSWFLGCRAGVTGRREGADTKVTSHRVVVEYCDYTQFPAFEDMMEVIRERGPAPGAPTYPLYWWSRKSRAGTAGNITYETGIAALVGSDWVIRHNRVHNSFEGLSVWCIRWSKNLQIHDNVFERIVDNAIELEDHSEGMRIYRNAILDTVEPLSWQPLDGTPWPGPAFIHENYIRNSEEINRLAAETSGHRPGWFKAGASRANWTRAHMKDVPDDVVRAPGAGVVVFNNTVVFPHGYFLTRTQPHTRIYENIHFVNNVVVAQAFSSREDYRGDNIAFRNNAWIGFPRVDGHLGEVFAGQGGVVVSAPPPGELRPEDFLLPQGLAAGAGAPVTEALEAFPEANDIRHRGAIPFGSTWAWPDVGPRARN